jgi:predicted RNase H-like HicB family nuclease
MEYTVILHDAEERGYWVEVPALPGCFSQGETVDETLANARDAISSHIEALREEKLPVPTDEGFVLARVTVPAGSNGSKGNSPKSAVTLSSRR